MTEKASTESYPIRVQLSKYGLEKLRYHVKDEDKKQRYGTVKRMSKKGLLIVQWDNTKGNKYYHQDFIEPIQPPQTEQQ